MKKLLFIALIGISVNMDAQKTPQNLIDDFFSTYENDPGMAIRNIYKTNVWMIRIQDDIDQVVNTVNGFTIDYMGEYYGYELITTKKFSESFELYSYLVKYDRQPIRYIFKFYKPKDSWVLYAFKLDDSIDDEIEQAAKLYNLDLSK